MPSIDELNGRFEISGGVARFEPGGGGLPRLKIATPAAEAQIYLHGAHVAHYQPKGAAPVLFVSSKSNYADGKPIRGGVPVIFPWFGPKDEKSPMHGLVRTRSWDVESVTRGNGDVVTAVFTFAADEQTRQFWPHDFRLRFTVAVGPTLRMTLDVQNDSPAEFKFEEALHTYFAITDARQTNIFGLGGTDYLDKNLNHARQAQAEPVIALSGPVDRVYVDSTSECVIEDAANARQIRVAKEHSRATVVWNPWADKIGTMPDLDPSEWPKFVCVETCNVKVNAVTLAAGGVHRMTAEISVQGPVGSA